MSDTPPSDHAIREHAFRLWEEAGQPEGREEEFWHKARNEMNGDESPAPGAAPRVDQASDESVPASDATSRT